MALFIHKITKEDIVGSIEKLGNNNDLILILHKNTIDRQLELPKVDRKYWKLENDFFVEMNAEEKTEADNDELDLIKQKYIDSVNYQTNISIDGGFDFEGDIYQSEAKDIDNYQSLLHKKHLLGDFIRITLKNKLFKIFDTTKLDALTDAAFVHKAILLEANKVQIDAIRACNTVEELEAL